MTLPTIILAIAVLVVAVSWLWGREVGRNNILQRCQTRTLDCLEHSQDAWRKGDCLRALSSACEGVAYSSLIDHDARIWFHESIAWAGMLWESKCRFLDAAECYREARNAAWGSNRRAHPSCPDAVCKYYVRESSCLAQNMNWELAYDRANSILIFLESRHNGFLGIAGDTARSLRLNRFVAALHHPLPRSEISAKMEIDKSYLLQHALCDRCKAIAELASRATGVSAETNREVFRQWKILDDEMQTKLLAYMAGA